MDIRTARQELLHRLRRIYDPREASLIADMVVEHVTGHSRTQRLIHGADALSDSQVSEIRRCSDELLRWRPVQYVLGEAWFAGMRLQVDERVLIPRPETEELVEWCLSSLPRTAALRILDVGTGSGCIALALAKALPMAEVWAADKSRDALAAAADNARETCIDLRLLELDVLDRHAWDALPAFDIIISNPPYVLDADKSSIRDNVLQYEPHMALFVEDPDPLRFYDAISSLALLRLASDGRLFFEVHEEKGPDVQSLLRNRGFREVILRKDLSGRDRMVRAQHS
jgi:release factor glutamine methyltransferase